MTQPTQRQVDSDLEQSMQLFSRAQVGETTPLEPLRLQRVVVALDGSTQDVAAALLAKQLSTRLNCQLAYVQILTSDDVSPNAESIATLNSISAERIVNKTEAEESYEQILAAVTQAEADLLIVPCPFARDFESVGEDSTGTVIDVLTARLEIPFIAIRRPDAIGRDPTSNVRLILTGENPAAETAARWAVGLVAPEGRIELLLLVEESFYENFRATLEAIQPSAEVTYEDLENALARKHGRLHAALQHTAPEVGFEYELLIRHEGDEQPITPEDPKTHPALMVLAMQRSSRDSQGEVHEFVRRSPHPVFVATVS